MIFIQGLILFVFAFVLILPILLLFEMKINSNIAKRTSKKDYIFNIKIALVFSTMVFALHITGII